MTILRVPLHCSNNAKFKAQDTSMIFMKSAGKNSLSSELMLPQSYLEGLG